MPTADTPCLCTALRKASRAVTRCYEQAMAETGLTIVQFALLRHLSREGDLPLSRLAEQQVMDRTTLYRTLAPLERDGRIIIRDKGGRIKIAALSPAGRQAMLDATPAWQTAQTRIHQQIGAAGWSDLANALQPVIAVSQEEAA